MMGEDFDREKGGGGGGGEWWGGFVEGRFYPESPPPLPQCNGSRRESQELASCRG